MISTVELISEFINDHGWSINDHIVSSDNVKLLCIKRLINVGQELTKLNIIIKQTKISIWNPYKIYDACEAELSLYDPCSMDQLEKILA